MDKIIDFTSNESFIDNESFINNDGLESVVSFDNVILYDTVMKHSNDILKNDNILNAVKPVNNSYTRKLIKEGYEESDAINFSLYCVISLITMINGPMTHPIHDLELD
jgi:hypothetical protein